MVVSLARIENDRREVRVIDCVRIALSFNAKREISIDFNASSNSNFLQVISAVKLASEFGGLDGHDTASLGLSDSNSMRHFFLIIRLIQRHAVIVTASNLLDLIESLADGMKF